MKKIVIALLLVVALVVSLAACGEKFVCDLCDEEKTSTKHEMELLGEKIVYCDDCAEELEELGDAFDLG